MGRNEETVKVVVRCRPLNSTEKADGRERIVTMDTQMGTVVVKQPGASSEPPKTFTFDMVFDETSRQEVIYQKTAMPIVDSVLEGFNGTIFAYGQTGTGKTFSMEGVNEPPELRGIIPRAFMQVFERIAARAGQATEFLVRASYLEIYNEEVRDLLAKNAVNKLELKEDPNTGVYVKDLTSYVVKSVKECDKLRDFGASNRHVGATKMNADSSRSHSIYTITVESCETDGKGEAHIRMGKLNLVDLAGSERQSKTAAEGDRLKEATKINLSLSALGNCISALVDGKSKHIPYRDSKLTRLLQDSLGGNTKTVMVANMGPADWNFDESISTLRYANRAKNIKNKPKINEDPKDAMLREFQEEIARLRAQLEAEGEVGPDGQIVGMADVDGEMRRIGGAFKEVQVEKVVEVEKIVQVERVVEREVQVERLIEVEVEREVEEIVHIEKEVGIRHEEVNRMQRELMTQAEKEKQELLDAQLQDREEKLRLNQQLNEVKQTVTAERDAIVRAKHRLKQLESKLIHNGENLLDKSMAQEMRQQRLAAEMEERRLRQQEIERALAAEEEKRLGLEESYATLQEEVDGKTRKLKRLWAKYKAAQAEIRDVQDEFNREKEDILETVRELSRQLKLKQLLMSACIPLEQLSKIERCSEWDEANESWRISRIQYAGNARAKNRGRRAGMPGAGSPLRSRGDHKKDKGTAAFNAVKAMASVYFSYDTDVPALDREYEEEQ